jgi:hypothetical protein
VLCWIFWEATTAVDEGEYEEEMLLLRTTFILNWFGEICLPRAEEVEEVEEKISSLSSPVIQPKAKIPLCLECPWRSKYKHTLEEGDWGRWDRVEQWSDRTYRLKTLCEFLAVKDCGMQFWGRFVPNSVEILTWERGSVVAIHNSVRIEHGNNFEDTELTELIGFWRVRDQEINHSLEDRAEKSK